MNESAPATPPMGEGKYYVKDRNTVFFQDPAGKEHNVSEFTRHRNVIAERRFRVCFIPRMEMFNFLGLMFKLGRKETLTAESMPMSTPALSMPPRTSRLGPRWA